MYEVSNLTVIPRGNSTESILLSRIQSMAIVHAPITLPFSSSPSLTAFPLPCDDPTVDVSFRNCRNLRQIEQIHCREAKTHSSAAVHLIAACVDVGTRESLSYAVKAFRCYRKEESFDGSCLYVLNSLLRGSSSAGLGEDALFVYVEMVEMGIVPDKYSLTFLLNACAKLAGFSECLQAHGVVVKMGLSEDLFVGNSLIHCCCECSQVVEGRKVFDEMLDRNLVSWTSLICGYSRSNCPEEAVSLFFNMLQDGVKPNAVTMVCTVSACSRLQDRKLGKRVHGYIRENSIEVNDHVTNALVDMYMKCGEFDAARKIFEECRDRDLVLFNTILSNYARVGMMGEVVRIVDQMWQSDVRPDRVTVLALFSASADSAELKIGKQCHCYVLRNGLLQSDNVSTAIIDMYMKCRKPELASIVFSSLSRKNVGSWNSLVAGHLRNSDLESARKIFYEMPIRDAVSFNTLIGSFVQESRFDEAIGLFRTMQREGIKPDRITMTSVASACRNLGSLGLGKWILFYIEHEGIDCDLHLFTALIDMFGKCGDPVTAMRVFEKMETRDVSAWTAIICAMAAGGCGKLAIDLFDKMLSEGLKPDNVTFVGVLTACSHGGLVDVGRRIFGSMEGEYGIFPEVVHYGCMVDMLGRAGHLEEAREFIEGMPIEPNDIIWHSYLSACRIHKNVEMATYAAARIDQLSPGGTATAVILSNMYASTGKWSNVRKVRLEMKENGMIKLPGFSYTEIDGAIHEFTAGDESHPEIGRIESMLHEINCRVRDAGHVPDLSNVTLNVNDDEEKEVSLSRHSEKLAMSYALITTDKGTPIRVVKNLRTCPDCHGFAKFVSKVYDRDIVLRDNTRFHFFKEGVCSCNDFW